MKLDEAEFKSSFVGSRLGQDSKALEILSNVDTDAIRKVVISARRCADVFWEEIKDLETKTTHKKQNKEKIQISIDQWEALGAAQDLSDLLTDFQKGFVKDRIKVGSKQFVTTKQAGIISSIRKRIEP